MSLKEHCREGQERNKLSQVLETDNSEKSLSMFVYLSILRHLIYPACFILTGLLFFLERFWRHGELRPPPPLLCEVEYHSHFMISELPKACPGYRAPGSEEPHSGSLRSWKSLGFYGLTLTYAILHLLAVYIPINVFTLRCGNCLIQTLTLENSK